MRSEKKPVIKEYILCFIFSFLYAFACSAGKWFDREGILNEDFRAFYLPLVLITAGTFVFLVGGA